MSDLIRIPVGRPPREQACLPQEVYKYIQVSHAEEAVPELLRHLDLFRQIPKTQSRESYAIPSHQGHREPPSPEASRWEEWICIMVCQEAPDRGYPFGRLVDYQVPLKAPGGGEQNQGLGKIDLLAHSGDTATLLELKAPNSTEHPLKAFLEIYTYWKLLGGLVDAQNFLDNSAAKGAERLDKAVLLYRDSKIARRLEAVSPEMRDFLRQLEVKCYLVDQVSSGPYARYLFDHMTEYPL